jgi:hypothetical protein
VSRKIRGGEPDSASPTRAGCDGSQNRVVPAQKAARGFEVPLLNRLADPRAADQLAVNLHRLYFQGFKAEPLTKRAQHRHISGATLAERPIMAYANQRSAGADRTSDG